MLLTAIADAVYVLRDWILYSCSIKPIKFNVEVGNGFLQPVLE